MKKHALMLTTSAFIVAWGAMAASAQQNPGVPMTQKPDQTQQQPAGQESHGMSRQRGMMGCGMMEPEGMMGRMMGPGMMGHGGMMGPFAMRIIFALMDSDGDGTISLQEFQAGHERIFKAMDANKDGVLTLEEMQVFMRGPSKSAPQQ